MKKKKIYSKLASYLVTALLITSICLCLFVFVQVVNRGYVSIFGYSFFRVYTGSMEPSIPVGSLILTKETDIEDIEINDIVSFYSKEKYMQGKIITHRVVGKDQSPDGKIYLTTRGDANSAADVHFADSENLIGKLKWCSEDGNVFANILAFLSGSFGFFSCIALPALLIAVVIFKRCIGTMMTEIKKLRAEMNGEAKNDISPQDEWKLSISTEFGMTIEEFDEMYARLRADVMEELKQINDREQPKTE